MHTLEAGFLLNDRYNIIRMLGKGGMGMVYLANDTSLDHQVAVKENIGPGEERSQQFLKEARLLASLRHPNLPRVTDYFIVGDLQYLVMDFLEGDDLQSLLEREGRQPVEKVLNWAADLVEAFQYMHTQKPPVIHRDIKPANIRLRADGHAALVDFGIAKAAESSQHTAAGAKGYTPGFASPEQAGGGRTSPRSDQYSLAATIFTLLTGNRPEDSVNRILQGAPLQNPSTLNPQIPLNVSTALCKAMSLRPEDRFEDVISFQTALQDIDFRWDESTSRIGKANNGKDRRPGWMNAAFVIIGILIIAILGISMIAAFGLMKHPDISTGNEATEIVAKLQDPTQMEFFNETEVPGPQVTEHSEMEALGDVTAVPDLSPTLPVLAAGKWIAYSSDRGDGKTLQIWVMRSALNNAGKPVAIEDRQITDSPGDKTYPAWSTDGKFLLYSGPSAERANGLDIWRVSIDGGNAQNLTNRKGDDLFASWSPDGAFICFTNTGRDDGIPQLFLMNDMGVNQRRVSSDYSESQGVWTPDMRSLLFVLNASDNRYFSQRSELADYKTPQPYDVAEVFGRLGQVTDPAFSPDGSMLAYTKSKGREKRIGIVNYSSRGADFNLITNSGIDAEPAWSADGKWIAFTSERDGNPEIYIMTTAGLIQTNVSMNNGRDMHPAWQP
jgi:serine/threonine-protein kinase